MREQGHDHKPNPRLFGKDRYWLGVELEVEASNMEHKIGGLAVLRQPKWCYAKHDGSLSCYGWELVTHPISRKLWLDQNPNKTPVASFFRLVGELRALDYRSHDNSRCGMHIHISWSAFDGIAPLPPGHRRTSGIGRRRMRRKHIYWFMRLVNGPLFAKLSQRKDGELNQWARQLPVATNAFHETCYRDGNSRYVATNWTENTLEVRIFRGNMREDRIRKNLESVIAAVEFTRMIDLAAIRHTGLFSRPHGAGFGSATRALRQKNLEQQFIKWVGENQPTYPNLASYLTEHGQLKQAEDREVAVCV